MEDNLCSQVSVSCGKCWCPQIVSVSLYFWQCTVPRNRKEASYVSVLHETDLRAKTFYLKMPPNKKQRVCILLSLHLSPSLLLSLSPPFCLESFTCTLPSIYPVLSLSVHLCSLSFLLYLSCMLGLWGMREEERVCRPGAWKDSGKQRRGSGEEEQATNNSLWTS